MAASSNGQTHGLYSYDSFGTQKSNHDSHFLWWCAGTHQPLLRKFPSEHSKYAGLGGVILATFVLAALSSGYAIYSVFDSWAWALAFSVVWGLIIFNFDRFLVSTMRKYGVRASRQLWMAIPRMTLALLIGITIARPLELKIFEKEIDVQVLENRHKKILLNDSLLQAENKAVQLAASQERGRLVERRAGLEDTLRRLQQAYVQEADGTGGSLHRGIEKLTLLKQQAYEQFRLQATPELGRINQQIGYQDSILNHAAAENEIKRQRYEAELTTKVGFLERNKALSDISGRESSVFWANFFISLLIILIEIGPVLSKLIMSVGPYDLALAKEELLQMATSENEMRRDKELLFDKLQGIYDSKKKTSGELTEKLSALQKKHIHQEIDNWERGGKSQESRIPINDLIKKIKEDYDYSEDHVL